jgi:hypothetical protein
MLIKNGFPVLEELVLSKNKCLDFESIEIKEGELQHLKSLDLSENQITSSHAVDLLNKFPNLENLNLTGNYLVDIKTVSKLGRLKALNLHQNQIKEVNFVNDLAKMTCLESLRISDNIVLSTNDSVHVKYLATASLPNIKIMNGTPLTPYQIKDCKIYYWKNPFHEFFVEHNMTHHNFIFSELYMWARDRYVMMSFYLMEFDTPYECSVQKDFKRFLDMSDEQLREETLLAREKTKVNAEIERKKKEEELKKKKAIEGAFVTIRFEYQADIIIKKIPKKVQMSFVLNFVKTKFKLKNKNDIKMKMIVNEFGVKYAKVVEDYSEKVASFIDSNYVVIQVSA